jgi:adenylate kinase family enzyme
MEEHKMIKPLSNKPLSVNLIGAPGAGKSTGAALVFAKLKMMGINAEYVTEFAKDKAWEHNEKAVQNQAYVFGKQCYRMSRCADEVDVLITDSPLFLSIIYNNDPRLTDNFNRSVLDVFNSYNNLNILLKRVKPYNPKGRFQTEEGSDELGRVIEETLNKYDIPYITINGDEDGYNKIVDLVIKKLDE